MAETNGKRSMGYFNGTWNLFMVYSWDISMGYFLEYEKNTVTVMEYEWYTNGQWNINGIAMDIFQ